MRKLITWSLNKRGLSPIFATMLLAAIIMVFGSVAYYYSSNLTTAATDDYISTSSNNQQAISERIGFENAVYNSSSQTLAIDIINCGIANNVQISSAFLYDTSHNIVGQPRQGSIPSPSGGPIFPLYSIDNNNVQLQDNRLNVGQEGHFTINSVLLSTGSMYTIHLLTKSGSSFDYAFTA
jgi:hypothetical protein